MKKFKLVFDVKPNEKIENDDDDDDDPRDASGMLKPSSSLFVNFDRRFFKV
jgi:hypothetical protein